MIQPNSDQLSTAALSPVTVSPAARYGGAKAAAGLTPAERTELATLVVRALAGDSPAQSELVRKYRRRISGQVRLIIRQPDDVEDVVQIVFTKMFRRLARLRDPGSFESWLFRLSRNTALDFIRRRRCRPVTVPAENDFFEIPDPANPNSTNEILDALRAALAQVSPKDRELVTLFVQGNSYHSLAARHGLTLGAVKARLHRIRPHLRTFVGEATETRLAGADRWGTAAGACVAA
ncbi:MAG: sigma-70 family RNA polymerase sigma factor [Verrucomicrobia bacterium]|nr:sigma-70 family RNA polymerase sigma factor [Verrucomicrobiota bacterium]